MKLRTFSLVPITCLLVASCAITQTQIPAPQAKQVSLGWIKNTWRTCEENSTCPKITPKTVVIPAVAQHVQPPIVIEPPLPEKKNIEVIAGKPMVIHYEFASAIPTPEGLTELEVLLNSIKTTDSLVIEGYTDDMGSAELNAVLARDRAKHVLLWLKARGLKNPMHIEARGRCCYVSSNASEKERARNRRVEVHSSISKEVIN